MWYQIATLNFCERQLESNHLPSLCFPTSKGSVLISLPIFLFFGNLIPPLGYNLWSFFQPWSLLNFQLPSTHSFLMVPLVSQDVENWPSVVKVKPVSSPMSHLCYDTSKLSVFLPSSTTISTQVWPHVPSPELLQWLPPVSPSLTSRLPAAKLIIFPRCCPDCVTPLFEIFIYCSPQHESSNALAWYSIPKRKKRLLSTYSARQCDKRLMCYGLIQFSQQPQGKWYVYVHLLKRMLRHREVNFLKVMWLVRGRAGTSLGPSFLSHYFPSKTPAERNAHDFSCCFFWLECPSPTQHHASKTGSSATSDFLPHLSARL